MRRLVMAAALVFGPCLHPANADEANPVKILLIAKDRDHAFSQHEYLSDCGILAKCLRQTKGVEAEVSNGWPRDSSKLKGVKALVFNTRMGGSVLFDPLVKPQAEKLRQQARRSKSPPRIWNCRRTCASRSERREPILS